MLFICIIALIVGIIAGTITGLLPGIHINLVSAFLISIPLGLFSPISLVIFIVSMTITHTFIDFIPSIFLGSPDSDTALSILPGHEFLLKGKGHEALILTLYGCLLGVLISLILTPIFIFILPKVYSYLSTIMFFILLITNIYLIAKEKSSKPLALLVFFLSGFLGLATLNLPLKESLLPLLSGLFGSSSLITSIIKKETLPRQEISSLSKIKITKKELLNSGLAAFISAPLCSILPSLGSGQAAVIGSDLVSVARREFLILLGAINILVASLSFVAVYSIGKARTGTSVAVQKLLETFALQDLLIIVSVIILVSLIAFFITLLISKILANKISLINYKFLSLAVLAFICIIVLVFSGFLGFLVFLISTGIGLFTILSGIRRTHLMGSLMLPSILLYLPI